MSKYKGRDVGEAELQAGKKARLEDHIKTKLMEEPIMHTQKARVSIKKREVGTQRDTGVERERCGKQNNSKQNTDPKEKTEIKTRLEV